MSEPPPPPARPARTWILSGALSLAALAFLLCSGLPLTRTTSVTADEPGHFSAGLGYWDNDYRQTTENFFLTQKWAAWGAHAAGTRAPEPKLQQQLQWRPTWIGEALLFSGQVDPVALLAPARCMTLVLCLVAGLLVWGWAAKVGGPWAGALALLLYATSPVVLSMGVLVTTDTGTALAYVGAVAGYAWLLRRPGPASACVAGASAGLLALCKFTVAVWVVSAALLLAWHLWTERHHRRLGQAALWHAAACLAAYATIWGFFGWQFRPGGITYLAFTPATPLQHAVVLLDHLRALPEPFLREILFFGSIVNVRPGYLLGSFHEGGSWLYFPVAFQCKCTLAMLLGLAAWFFPRPRPWPIHPGVSALAAGALGYTACAIASSVNIGVRHILPLFLLAAIAGGIALARMVSGRPVARAFVLAVVVLAAAEGVAGRAKPLAFFNALWGGPMAGYRVMVESSLEWGGDLPDLAAWERQLRAHDNASPVYVSLLGPPGLEHFGVPVADMGSAFENGLVRPGYFVFSATRLFGGPADYYGQWGEALRERWMRDGAASWREKLPFLKARLAVARLAASCRELAPSERIGPVYFVYHLDQKALETALSKDAP